MNYKIAYSAHIVLSTSLSCSLKYILIVIGLQPGAPIILSSLGKKMAAFLVLT